MILAFSLCEMRRINGSHHFLVVTGRRGTARRLSGPVIPFWAMSVGSVRGMKALDYQPIGIAARLDAAFPLGAAAGDRYTPEVAKWAGR